MKSVFVYFLTFLVVAHSIFAAPADAPPNGDPALGSPPLNPAPGDLNTASTFWWPWFGGWGGGWGGYGGWGGWGGGWGGRWGGGYGWGW